MALNRLSVGFVFNDLPEFCGPGDLADCVISLRNHQIDGFKVRGTAPISDEGVRKLIDLTYHASMVSEEGRFPTFRVVSHHKEDIRTIAECDVTLDSVDKLRRIAPAVSGDHRVALLVRDDTGPLRCIGLALVDDMGFSVKPGRPEIVGFGTGPTLHLHVEGPGKLRCRETMGPYGAVRLAGSRIQQVIKYSHVTGVSNLLTVLADRILDRIVAIKGEDSKKWFGGFTYPLVEKVLARSLDDATDLGHGGSFVFLPTLNRNVDDFDIQCKYPATLNLGHLITEFWCACIDCAVAVNETHREQANHQWRWKRDRLFSSATAMSGLSAVDGCVVLNQELDVLGFGGVIGLGESDAKVVESPRKLKNIRTGVVYEDSEIAALGLGTRHRSAFRFCKAHANSLIFVISQDGDLRVFFSDNDFVYGFEHLFAWVYDSEVA